MTESECSVSSVDTAVPPHPRVSPLMHLQKYIYLSIYPSGVPSFLLSPALSAVPSLDPAGCCARRTHEAHTLLTLLTLLFGSITAASPDLRPFFESASAGGQLAAMLECKDENDGCPSWAAAGECTNNAGFMHATYRKACERCDLSGVDAHDTLEIATYAARNLHAGCTAADPVRRFGRSHASCCRARCRDAAGPRQ